MQFKGENKHISTAYFNNLGKKTIGLAKKFVQVPIRYY